MLKTTLPIRGMHCKSCEILIEDELTQIKGIEKAEVNRKTGEATVYYKGSAPRMGELTRAVKNAGYEVGRSKGLPFISRRIEDYYELGLALVIMVLLYLIGNEMGLFGLGVQGNGSYASLPVVFLVGLTAGVSTCMALVGGLVLGVASRFAEENARSTAAEKFKPHLFFNLGRIVSFFVLGGLIGLIGSVFKLSAGMLGGMTIAVGLVMVFLGLQLVGIFPALSGFSLTLPKGLSRMLGVKTEGEEKYSHKSAFIIGALTFFVPCGFTQAMQLFAMGSGSFMTGALTMTVFALGTAPGLLGVGGLTSLVKGQFSRMFFKFAGVVVIALAVFNISNGINLAGLKSWKASPVEAVQDPNVVMENGIQVVRMSQTSNGYSPDTFTVKKGIPVKWIVKSEDPYSCASSLYVPDLNIRTLLTEKEQVFEFIPDKAGTIRFTCSMGMYGGRFNVIDTNDAVPTPMTAITGAAAQVAAQQPVEDAPEETPDSEVQVLNASYTAAGDVQPREFEVRSGSRVRFEIEAKDDGFGCMSTVMIPGLYNDPQLLEKGKTLTMDFTAAKKGTYPITCAMGMQRGTLTVN